MAAAYVCLLGGALAGLAIPRLLGTAIDQALLAERVSSLVAVAIIILAVSAGRGMLAYGQQYLSEAVAQRVAYDLRNSLYDKLQHMSFAFHDTQQTGDLMSRATADVENVRWFIQFGLLRLLQLAVLVAGAAVFMLTVNWRVGLISMAFIPFAVWRVAVLRITVQRVWLEVQRLLGEMTTVLQESLTGVRVVRAFGAEHHVRSRFQEKAEAVRRNAVEANLIQAANNAQVTLVFAIGLGCILGYGAYEMAAGRLTAGQLTQFIFYNSMLAMPVRMSGFAVNILARGISSGQRLLAVLEAVSPVRDREQARDIGRVTGHVRFSRVGFAYRDGARVLDEIAFEARPGQIVALLGKPGSGKSTVAHLVPRFYDVTEGSVTVDGMDVRDTTLASLRRNVGIVMQDVFVFSATLRDNIAYGHPDATDADVERAARIAQLHDFIVSLPDGYQTMVGERGVTLSGGQRQRLAIARSVLLDPPILILDDTMSSVDAETEARLQRALSEVMRNRTTFVIAHRLTTVLAADLILVLDEGRIAERGTHAELLARGGLYREIYEGQLLSDSERIAAQTNGAGVERGAYLRAAPGGRLP
jgi:ATP-binding cassette subfamily B protein